MISAMVRYWLLVFTPTLLLAQTPHDWQFVSSSGKVKVHWSARDLTVLSGTAPLWSVSGNGRTYPSEKELDPDRPGWFELYAWRPLSLVGPYFSSESIDKSGPGKIRSLFTDSIDAVRIDRKVTPISLTDLFSGNDLAAALAADPVIKRWIGDESLPEPVTLKDLEVATGRSPLLDFTCFAFHHLEGDKVAVRIAISADPAIPGAIAQLGILLPIPPSLRAAFQEAASGRAGFLMSAMDKRPWRESWTVDFEESNRRTKPIPPPGTKQN